MSANDYYQSQHAAQQPQSYQPYQPSGLVPLRNDYGSYGQPATSPYQTDVDYRPPPNTSGAYTENIPLKDQSRIHVNQNEWPMTQQTAYPPSPESQNPNPALLPPSSGKLKRKRKNRFFSGKVPWFVYFISLVQVTVFIVEIIKNCKHTSVWFSKHIANTSQQS